MSERSYHGATSRSLKVVIGIWSHVLIVRLSFVLPSWWIHWAISERFLPVTLHCINIQVRAWVVVVVVSVCECVCVCMCVCVCVCGGGGGVDLFTCPYPLKIRARPPRDQRLALRSGVSGQEEPRSYIEKLFIGGPNVSTTNEMVKNLSTTDFTCSTGWLTGLKNSRIDPSWWTHRAISRSSHCSPLVQQRPWYVLSCPWDGAYKRTLAANRKE